MFEKIEAHEKATSIPVMARIRKVKRRNSDLEERRFQKQLKQEEDHLHRHKQRQASQTSEQMDLGDRQEGILDLWTGGKQTQDPEKTKDHHNRERRIDIIV